MAYIRIHQNTAFEKLDHHGDKWKYTYLHTEATYSLTTKKHGPNLHPRGKGLHDMSTNPCSSETSDLELSNAQGFESTSLTVASEYSIENP